jgi:vacuolar-type H+-ATPase subunit E/Vma4
MGLKEIEIEIMNSGKKETDRFSRETEAEINKIKKQIDEKATSMTKKLEDKAAKEMELERKRILANANLRIKEKVEKRKDEIIEKVFSDVREKIMGMDNKGKSRMLKKLAEEGKDGIGKPTVWVDRKYAKLLPGAKAREIGDFGVIVTSGHITVDNTLTSKLENIKSDSRHKVAGVLWQK